MLRNYLKFLNTAKNNPKFVCKNIFIVFLLFYVPSSQAVKFKLILYTKSQVLIYLENSS